jgi:hypothetical protein
LLDTESAHHAHQHDLEFRDVVLLDGQVSLFFGVEGDETHATEP